MIGFSQRRAAGAGLVVVAIGTVSASAQELEPFRQMLPGTLVEFEMRPVPAGTTVLLSGEVGEIEVEAFWIGRTEVPWELYDIFALRLDIPRAERMRAVDAEARPSRPYGAPDYGFGHQGFAAISVTYRAAEAFCAWLSARTGQTYRLPTDAEWTLAVQAGYGEWDDVRLDDVAWYGANSMQKTHPVATRAGNRLGVFDMVGNVWEWVTGVNGPVVRGGSYRDAAADIGPDARTVQDRSWNSTDPQIPKSRWWLSDAPFVGFRIVRIP